MSYFKSNSPREIPKQSKYSAFFTLSNSSKISFVTIIVLSILIFLSIIPLASSDIWNEAIVVAVIYVLSGVNIWINKMEIEHRQLLAPIFILAGFSFLQGFATVLFSVYSAIFPISFDPTASIWGGFKILAFALFLGLLLETTRQNAKFLTWSLIFTGNFFAVFGIARYLLQPYFAKVFNSLLAPQLNIGVGFGTYFNQNHFAFLMLMVFGLNIVVFWYGKLSMGIRFLFLPASLITWTALVLSGSRGGIIGSFAEIIVLIFLPAILSMTHSDNSRKKSGQSNLVLFGRQSAIFVVIFGLLIVGIVLIGQDRVIERFEQIPQQIGGITNAATFRRTDVWFAALAIIKDFPIFGTGFGGFQVVISQYIDISGQIVPKQAHNDYLELAASGGVVAVALAVWFLFRFFSFVKKRFAEPSDSFSAVVRIGAICGIAGTALHNFFDFGLQMPANLLFFIALIYLAVHKTRVKRESEINTSTQNNNIAFKLLFSIICIFLTGWAVLFGFASYQYKQAKSNPNIEYIEQSLVKFPFDGEYFETRSEVFEHFGKFENADFELKKALEYRPKDYNLWINLGEIEQSLNHGPAADNAFRRAIELAPNYGKPYLNYGNFLIKTDRKADGFTELRIASQKNPQYFSEIVGILWTETAGDAQNIFKILEPHDHYEKEKLASFLFEKGAYAPLTQLVCRDSDLSEPTREGLVRELFEKKRFYFADRIYKRNCDDSEVVKSEIEDGDFEKGNLQEGTGFGWRIEKSSSNTIIGFDEINAGQGKSLRFNFNGQDKSFALLSQTVVVGKKSKYKLTFSYKTSEIITGGLPVVQIIIKQPDQQNFEKIAGETTLSLNEKNWLQSSIEFETDQSTEAVEIRLTRKSCAESLCPIFGMLWLDDFHLEKKN